MDSKRSYIPTSAEIIAGNQDLLVDTILLWLSAKPLMRFKVVSKQWRFLISDDSFSRRHVRRIRPKSQPSYILHPRFHLYNNNLIRANEEPYYYFSPINPIFPILHSFVFQSEFMRIVQSCNGLLLLEVRCSRYGKKSYAVFNPIQQRSSTIPTERHAHILGICLAFDPSISLHYKIVCVRNPDYSVEVYDSKSMRWTSFGTPFPADTKTKFINNGIYWNNRVYWFWSTAASYYFDLQTGIVGIAPMIKTSCRMSGEINKNYIMESNGRVHYVSISLRHNQRALYVFELMDDHSSWIEVYKIDISYLAYAFPLVWMQMMNGRIEVLGFVRGDTKEESSALFHVPGMIFRFKFSDRSFEVVLDVRLMDFYQPDELQFTRFDTFRIIENLTPLI